MDWVAEVKLKYSPSHSFIKINLVAKVYPPEKGSCDLSLKVSQYFLVKQN